MYYLAAVNGMTMLGRAMLDSQQFDALASRATLCGDAQRDQTRLGYVRHDDLNEFEATARANGLTYVVKLCDLVWENPGAKLVISTVDLIYMGYVAGSTKERAAAEARQAAAQPTWQPVPEDHQVPEGLDFGQAYWVALADGRIDMGRPEIDYDDEKRPWLVGFQSMRFSAFFYHASLVTHYQAITKPDKPEAANNGQ